MSTTVEVTWAESSYRAASMFMGLISILMIVSAVIYASTQTAYSFAVIFFGIFLLSYIVPLLVNCAKLKVSDFLKGVIYATYLSPTYVNILTIYAIANIHDITWGSRPDVQMGNHTSTEKKKDILYKDYRSRFLVFWALVNAAVGVAISSSAYFIIVVIGGFLGIVMLFKIVLSIVHTFKEKCDRFRVKRYIRKCTSEVFDKEKVMEKQNKNEEFTVYYDDHDENLYIYIG